MFLDFEFFETKSIERSSKGKTKMVLIHDRANVSPQFWK